MTQPESQLRRAFVSIGTNVNREWYVEVARRELLEAFGEVTFSPVYETGAVGFDGSPFYNLAAGFDTEQSPDALVARFKAMEARHGRKRGGGRFADRTLDLDLLLLGDLVLEAPGVQLPRDEITRHAFVLGPLADIAADVIHPVLNTSIGRLWETFDPGGQWLRRVEVLPSN
ncbi:MULTISPECIES: 2-amino-4-hydroxy-6-hydroxymethyldihydropteridine diphosphokinase [unclassified Ectothiorhodospira]|uniref:2-amino-4-hydroxy-6- hydroxymethyldihydropteridine diphosphokinase n=1 Tax=unclassified Ectothiorhodospira TaxID=2684909 RepID=UPI001EE92FBF|nr:MULTISPECIES: 2-amino-4-hydroxy-6-hydroxymethyldihydropteridine diphosphokinase [unclassified Ectothiorhodospira]MCG5517055.1 2-amino-4-hydroxy-6-hydroxymethyldihydropteridine diphosphokinase [Ectothiorhodospira sp. 9100]MCG5517751.1 2-amino-4-hydroxy-6-hydroxymethyldihydropteridine diphosphokinase [Ectothiorhodospira sp. 9905]